VNPAAAPTIRSWSLGQDRSHPERSDDAYRSDLAIGDNAWTAFLVVADGAGSTPFAGDWARALVAAAEAEWVHRGFEESVERVRETFDPFASGAFDDDFIVKDLWRERGSAATLAAAVVRSKGDLTRCRVSIVGDCLMVISEPTALASFPFEAANQFSNRTEAVRTLEAALNVQAHEFEVPPGSILALASDAMGAWLLKLFEREGAERVHRWLRTVTEDELPDVEDDLTLLVLDVPSLAPAPRGLGKRVRAFVGRIAVAVRRRA
jgi:hypothetical protein